MSDPCPVCSRTLSITPVDTIGTRTITRVDAVEISDERYDESDPDLVCSVECARAFIAKQEAEEEEWRVESARREAEWWANASPEERERVTRMRERQRELMARWMDAIYRPSALGEVVSGAQDRGIAWVIDHGGSYRDGGQGDAGE